MQGSALSLLLRERQLQVELGVWQVQGHYSDGKTRQEDCRGKVCACTCTCACDGVYVWCVVGGNRGWTQGES